MIDNAFTNVKNMQSLRNDSQKELFLIENKIADLQKIESPNKATKQDLTKAKETLAMLEGRMAETEIDENENPAAYTSNDLTVKRGLSNA